ncbi:hypothetical protein [Geminicoccus roseus]|uniref:hypothetical protein n=1 Tax=Geminicoccus roseus TaxID=404900 RepID=UPI0004048485|nr:hypothetical protein [Geminicoccus roseus]
MKLDDFLASLADPAPPAGLSEPVAAVWYGLNDQWEQAHGIVQAHEGEADADWVHAWLHRVEGDAGNAAYWYRRAGRPVARGDLKEEGRSIAAELLD